MQANIPAGMRKKPPAPSPCKLILFHRNFRPSDLVRKYSALQWRNRCGSWLFGSINREVVSSLDPSHTIHICFATHPLWCRFWRKLAVTSWGRVQKLPSARLDSPAQWTQNTCRIRNLYQIVISDKKRHLLRQCDPGLQKSFAWYVLGFGDVWTPANRGGKLFEMHSDPCKPCGSFPWCRSHGAALHVPA